MVQLFVPETGWAGLGCQGHPAVQWAAGGSAQLAKGLSLSHRDTAPGFLPLELHSCKLHIWARAEQARLSLLCRMMSMQIDILLSTFEKSWISALNHSVNLQCHILNPDFANFFFFFFSSKNCIELICFSRAPPFHEHSHGSVLLVSSSGETRGRNTLQSFMRVHSQKLNIKFKLEDVHAFISILLCTLWLWSIELAKKVQNVV